jgi:tetratricopeptide (TPR) repeat protein
MTVVAGGNVTIARDPLAAKALETLEQQLKKAGLREQESQDTIKALREAVTALAKKKELPDAPPGIDRALKQLAEGNAAAAETIFRDVAEKEEAEGKAANKEAAEAFRHLGALAFLHDTNKALDAYRRSTELDPENAKGWNQLGHLLLRKGELQAAESAYRKVAELGESSNDPALLAVAYGNLGIVYEIRGDLDQTVAMYNKALVLFQTVGATAQVKQVQGFLDKLKGH